MASRLIITYGLGIAYENIKHLHDALKALYQEPIVLCDLSVGSTEYMSNALIAAHVKQCFDTLDIAYDFRSVDIVSVGLSGVAVRALLAYHFTPNSTFVHHFVTLNSAHFGLNRTVSNQAAYHYFAQKFPHMSDTFSKAVQEFFSIQSHELFTLALDDRMGKYNTFKEHATLATSFISNGTAQSYSSIKEVGSDYYVRVSSANLQCDYLSYDKKNHPNYKHAKAHSGFGVIEHANAHTLIDPTLCKNPLALEFIKEALLVDDKQFATFCKKLARVSATAVENGQYELATHAYMQLHFRVQNSMNAKVESLFIDVACEDEWFLHFWHEEVVVHKEFKENMATFYIDTTALLGQLDKLTHSLDFIVCALPQATEMHAGHEDILKPFFTWDSTQIRKYIKHNSTLLIDVTLPYVLSKNKE